MNVFPRFLIVLALAFSSVFALAQSTAGNPDKIYGHDPLLYNGRIYSFFPPEGTGGNQYLNDEFDKQGSLKVRGVTFTNLALNYDIYNQLVVLEYKNNLGSTELIEVSAAWLEEFNLGGRHFEIKNGTDTTRRIFQVLGEGTEKILIFHRKDLKLDTRTASKDHFFADAIREMYVETGNKTLRFKNNRSFVSDFSLGRQDAVKKYLRKHKIRVKKASDYLMTELINYCNTLNGS
jgi:hypothetical protein